MGCVKSCISERGSYDLEDRNVRNMTSQLHLALLGGSLETIKTRLDAEDININDPGGNTPLHIVLYRTSFQAEEVCNFLLKKGANALLKNRIGDTPLLLAIDLHPDCVSLILRSSWGQRTVNTPDYLFQDYPIHNAVKFGNTKVLKLLLDHGALVDCKNIFGETPLHWASRDDCASILLERGADANVKDDLGRTPLHIAVIQGNKRVLKTLLKSGVDVNCRDFDGKTPLMFAKSDYIARLLLQYDAEVNARDNDGRTAIYHIGRSRRSSRRMEVLDELMDWGATPFVESAKVPSIFQSIVVRKL